MVQSFGFEAQSSRFKTTKACFGGPQNSKLQWLGVYIGVPLVIDSWKTPGLDLESEPLNPEPSNQQSTDISQKGGPK